MEGSLYLSQLLEVFWSQTPLALWGYFLWWVVHQMLALGGAVGCPTAINSLWKFHTLMFLRPQSFAGIFRVPLNTIIYLIFFFKLPLKFFTSILMGNHYLFAINR